MQRLEEEYEGEIDEDGLTCEERCKLYPYELHQIQLNVMRKFKKDDYDLVRASEAYNKPLMELQKNVNEIDPSNERSYSMIDDIDVLQQKANLIRSEQEMNSQDGIIQKYFEKSSYFRRLFPLIKEQKPGVDLYAYASLTQFAICVYILTYYSQMDTQGTQLLEQSSQFSINMVLFLIFTIFIMFLDRYINRTHTKKVLKQAAQNNAGYGQMLDDSYAEKIAGSNKRSMSINVDALKTRDSVIFAQDSADLSNQIRQDITLDKTNMTSQQLTKYFEQWILLIIYHIAIFWFFPLNSNYAIYGKPTCDKESPLYERYGCYDFYKNPVVQIFYIIFCIYFTLSAYQIRYGLPDFRRASSLTTVYDDSHYILYQLFYYLPFLVELKTLLDWCFTKTALDAFQWLELADLHAQMFFNKCANQYYFKRKLGTQIDKFEKTCCGCFCLGIILLFLVGPFIMFSDLSAFSDANLVTSSEVNFNLMIRDLETNKVYQSQIFVTDHALSITDYTQKLFKDENLDVYPETKFFEYDQVQTVTMKNSSDEPWLISDSYKNEIQELVKRAALGESAVQIQFALEYSFQRPGPATAQQAMGSSIRLLDPSNQDDLEVIKQFNSASYLNCEEDHHAKQEVLLEKFVHTEMRLTEFVDISYIDIFPTRDVNLVVSCDGFWGLNIDGEGIVFTTFSDYLTSGFLGSTSIMAFYLGVAYLVGTTLRSMIMYPGYGVMIYDIPNSSAILNLIDCIYNMRLEQNLKKEEELYFMLIEIMRSPEMLKAITGSSLKHDNNNVKDK